MKLIKSLIVGVFVLALVAAPAFAADCCDKAKAEGKTCEKCHPKTDDAKKDAPPAPAPAK